MLFDLYLTEYRFHDGFSPGVIASADLGPQTSRHALFVGGIFGNPTSWRIGHSLGVLEASGCDTDRARPVGAGLGARQLCRIEPRHKGVCGLHNKEQVNHGQSRKTDEGEREVAYEGRYCWP